MEVEKEKKSQEKDRGASPLYPSNAPGQCGDDMCHT